MTPRAARTALLILLALRLALSLAYSSLTPLGEAPDEADHYAYAAYIGTEGRLPSEPTMTQAKHPPIYHLLAAAVAVLSRGLRGLGRPDPGEHVIAASGPA